MTGVFVYSVAMRLFSAAAGLGITAVLGRLLGADGLGAFSYAMSWLSLAMLVTTLGFQHYAIRALPPMLVENQPGRIMGFITMSAALTGLVALATTLLTPAAIAYFRLSPDRNMESALMMAALLLVPMTLNQLRSGVLRGLGRPIAAQFPELILQPVFMLLLIGAAVLVRHSLDAEGAIFLAFVASVAGLAAGLPALVSAMRAVIAARPVFIFTGWLIGAAKSSFLFAAGAIMSATDIVMLGQLSTAGETGLYGVASRFFVLMNLPALAASATLSHEASRLHAAGQTAELDALSRATAAQTGVSAFALAMFCTLAAFHLDRIFGAEFAAAQLPVLTLVWVRAAEALFGHPGAILANTAFLGLTGVLVAMATLVNIVLNAVLIPGFGAQGAAMATGLSHFFLAGALAWTTYRKLGVASLPLGPWRRA